MTHDIASAAGPVPTLGKSNSWKRLVTALVLVPPATYLCYVGLLFVQDTLVGDGLILALKADWRRRLWDLFWSDWVHALPALYLICLLLMLPAYAGSRVLGRRSAWAAGLAGALCGGLAGSWLQGSVTPGAIVVPLLTGFISFYAFAIIASPDAYGTR